MTTALATLTNKLAARLDMGEGADLVATLKATAFKGPVSDAQLTALMAVANQYGLNPWTKEIYAFPDKNNGIVPVVGVDGWSRIINEHPQFDGIEFEQSEEACTCIIYRKDRSRPIKITEYKSECGRGTGPWQTHPKRMLRHKAMIQCARLAFGYGGIYEPDEAERIIDMGMADVIQPTALHTTATPAARPALEPYPQDRFDANLPKWRELVQTGQKTPEQIRQMVASKATLSEAQLRAIVDLTRPEPVPEEPLTEGNEDGGDLPF